MRFALDRSSVAASGPHPCVGGVARNGWRRRREAPTPPQGKWPAPPHAKIGAGPRWSIVMCAWPLSAARTYNQNHVPRKYTQGKRRVSIYWTWSYPWVAQRDLAEIDNRFSSMTEVRRVTWPAYEGQEWSAAQFLQGIAGALELFHRSSLSFQKITQDVTGSSRCDVPAHRSGGLSTAGR